MKQVKPDYYQKRRKANFSNIFEVFDDDLNTGGFAGNIGRTNEADSMIDQKKSLESDGYGTKGTINAVEAGSLKYNTEKKAKGYLTEGKNQRFNLRKVNQQDAQKQSTGYKGKGRESRAASITSGPASPRDNGNEEVEMQSPVKNNQ